MKNKKIIIPLFLILSIIFIPLVYGLNVINITTNDLGSEDPGNPLGSNEYSIDLQTLVSNTDMYLIDTPNEDTLIFNPETSLGVSLFNYITSSNDLYMTLDQPFTIDYGYPYLIIGTNDISQDYTTRFNVTGYGYNDYFYLLYQETSSISSPSSIFLLNDDFVFNNNYIIFYTPYFNGNVYVYIRDRHNLSSIETINFQTLFGTNGIKNIDITPRDEYLIVLGNNNEIKKINFTDMNYYDFDLEYKDGASAYTNMAVSNTVGQDYLVYYSYNFGDTIIDLQFYDLNTMTFSHNLSYNRTQNGYIDEIGFNHNDKYFWVRAEGKIIVYDTTSYNIFRTVPSNLNDYGEGTKRNIYINSEAVEFIYFTFVQQSSPYDAYIVKYNLDFEQISLIRPISNDFIVGSTEIINKQGNLYFKVLDKNYYDTNNGAYSYYENQFFTHITTDKHDFYISGVDLNDLNKIFWLDGIDYLLVEQEERNITLYELTKEFGVFEEFEINYVSSLVCDFQDLGFPDYFENENYYFDLDFTTYFQDYELGGFDLYIYNYSSEEYEYLGYIYNGYWDNIGDYFINLDTFNLIIDWGHWDLIRFKFENLTIQNACNDEWYSYDFIMYNLEEAPNITICDDTNAINYGFEYHCIYETVEFPNFFYWDELNLATFSQFHYVNSLNLQDFRRLIIDDYFTGVEHGDYFFIIESRYLEIYDFPSSSFNGFKNYDSFVVINQLIDDAYTIFTTGNNYDAGIYWEYNYLDIGWDRQNVLGDFFFEYNITLGLYVDDTTFVIYPFTVNNEFIFNVPVEYNSLDIDWVSVGSTKNFIIEDYFMDFDYFELYYYDGTPINYAYTGNVELATYFNPAQNVFVYSGELEDGFNTDTETSVMLSGGYGVFFDYELESLQSIDKLRIYYEYHPTLVGWEWLRIAYYDPANPEYPYVILDTDSVIRNNEWVEFDFEGIVTDKIAISFYLGVETGDMIELKGFEVTSNLYNQGWVEIDEVYNNPFVSFNKLIDRFSVTGNSESYDERAYLWVCNMYGCNGKELLFDVLPFTVIQTNSFPNIYLEYEEILSIDLFDYFNEGDFDIVTFVFNEIGDGVTYNVEYNINIGSYNFISPYFDIVFNDNIMNITAKTNYYHSFNEVTAKKIATGSIATDEFYLTIGDGVPKLYKGIPDIRMNKDEEKIIVLRDYFDKITDFYYITLHHPDTNEIVYVLPDEELISSAFKIEVYNGIIKITSFESYDYDRVSIGVCSGGIIGNESPSGCAEQNNILFVISVKDFNNDYLGWLFPTADSLGFGDRFIRIMLSMIFVIVLGIIFTKDSPESRSYVIPIISVILAFMFFFFVYINYISITVLLIIILIGIIVGVGIFRRILIGGGGETP